MPGRRPTSFWPRPREKCRQMEQETLQRCRDLVEQIRRQVDRPAPSGGDEPFRRRPPHERSRKTPPSLEQRKPNSNGSATGATYGVTLRSTIYSLITVAAVAVLVAPVPAGASNLR